MNKVLLGLFSFAAVLAAPIATSNQSLAQSSTPVSTETIEKWNTELRDQIRRLEAEKEGVELRQRARRLQAEKENAELHQRVRRLQSELSSAQSPALQQPSPQPQRAAAESSPQPQRAPPAERNPRRSNETEPSSA
jgi:TolA-binding protein